MVVSFWAFTTRSTRCYCYHRTAFGELRISSCVCTYVWSYLLWYTCRVLARLGVVVAAGAWSGHVLQAATGDAMWGSAFRARRGHLLQLQLPPAMAPLRHGLMEVDYSKVGVIPVVIFANRCDHLMPLEPVSFKTRRCL